MTGGCNDACIQYCWRSSAQTLWFEAFVEMLKASLVRLRLLG